MLVSTGVVSNQVHTSQIKAVHGFYRLAKDLSFGASGFKDLGLN